MSKTTPVRWWRDDADRYRSRGAYNAPPIDPSTPQWAMEILGGDHSGLAAMFEAHDRYRAEQRKIWAEAETAMMEMMRRFAEHVMGAKP